MRSKKITSIDVAKVAGVSQSTVSLVLNGVHENLSDSTIENVMQAAVSLGYSHRKRASSRQPVSDTVIIMSSSLPNPYYSELITSIEL